MQAPLHPGAPPQRVGDPDRPDRVDDLRHPHQPRSGEGPPLPCGAGQCDGPRDRTQSGQDPPATDSAGPTTASAQPVQTASTRPARQAPDMGRVQGAARTAKGPRAPARAPGGRVAAGRRIGSCPSHHRPVSAPNRVDAIPAPRARANSLRRRPGPPGAIRAGPAPVARRIQDMWGGWWATLESNQAWVSPAELQSAAAPCSSSPCARPGPHGARRDACGR